MGCNRPLKEKINKDRRMNAWMNRNEWNCLIKPRQVRSIIFEGKKKLCIQGGGGEGARGRLGGQFAPSENSEEKRGRQIRQRTINN